MSSLSRMTPSRGNVPTSASSGPTLQTPADADDLLLGGNAAAVERVHDATSVSEGTAPPDAPEGQRTRVGSDVDAIVNGVDVEAGERLIVLDVSTSDTGQDSDRYFDSETLYDMGLDFNLFERVRAGNLRLQDVAREVGPASSEILQVDGQSPSGATPTLAFSIEATRGRDAQGRLTWLTESKPVRASGNGMMAVTRLASAYLGAVPASDSLPGKVTLVGRIRMDLPMEGANASSRRETGLTNAPPSLRSKAEGTCSALVDALLGAMGYAGDVDPTWLDKAQLMAASGSARANGDDAESRIGRLWADSERFRTFQIQPLQGIADAVVEAVGHVLGARGSGIQPQGDPPDYDPSAVRQATFPNSRPVDGQGAPTRVFDALLQEGQALAARVEALLVAGLEPGMMALVPESFHPFVGALRDGWASRIHADFQGLPWYPEVAKRFRSHAPGTSLQQSHSVPLQEGGDDEGKVAHPPWTFTP